MNRASLAILAVLGAACGKQTFLAAAFVQTPSLPNPQNPGQNIPPVSLMTAYLGTINIKDPTKIAQLSSSDLGNIPDATNPTGLGPPQVAYLHTADPKVQGDTSGERFLSVCPSKDQPGAYLLSSATLCDKSLPGLTEDSQNDVPLTYEQTPYTLVLTSPGADGETYGARFEPGPAPSLQEFQYTTDTQHPELGCTSGACCKIPDLPAPAVTPPPFGNCIPRAFGDSTNLVVHRTDNTTGQFQPAFILVARVGSSDSSAPASDLTSYLSNCLKDTSPPGTPGACYKGEGKSKLPQDAKSLLLYVLSDADWRWDHYEIPGSTFSEKGAFYVVATLSVKQGKVSGNAFLGSTALTASGAAGIVWVQ